MSLDKGRTVRDLTKSIERQLGGPRKKPPAGAVDVAPKHETKIEVKAVLVHTYRTCR